MANTETGDLNVSQAAFDRLAYFALRAELLFDAMADVQPVQQSMPGSSVKFTIFNDLAEATSTLTESTDVTAVAMSDSQVEVTLQEYGNAVATTAKLRGTSFLDVDTVAANVIGYNAGASIDTIVSTILAGGDNVGYGTGGSSDPTSRATVEADDTITANDVRKATAQLRGANVPTFNGLYMGAIHPDVSYDLRSETGAAAWRDPHVYVDTENIYNGEIGAFEGCRFVETARAPLFADGGDSTTDVYGTLIMGRQALAKAHSVTDGNGPLPKIVRGPITDTLERFAPVGWYWLGGYARFREASLRRIESSSSIGAN